MIDHRTNERTPTMKINLLLIAATASLLAGCAGTMQDVNTALKKANEALKTPDSSASNGGIGGVRAQVGKMGDGRGYQPNLTVEVPRAVCNQGAFLDGVRDTYSQNWQQFVDLKVTTFKNLARAKNAEAAAKKNLALYQAHVIGMSNYVGKSGDYSPTNQCPYKSFVLGQEAGLNLYTRDSRSLLAQEQPLLRPL